MDPRIKDLAFGAALNSILRSASMGTNMGAELRRIGTLPPPGTTPESGPMQAVSQRPGMGLGGTEISPDSGGIGDVTGSTAPFGNPQTGITDSFGVPLTMADLVGRGVDVLSLMTSPISFLAGAALTGKTAGQNIKGMLTPVTTATPVISMAEIASQFGQQHGISPAEAMAILSGGSHTEMSGTPGPSADTSNDGGIGESGGSVGAGMGVM